MKEIKDFKSNTLWNKQGEKIQILLISNRLSKFIFKQSQKGKWNFIYFELLPLKFCKDYFGLYISLYGRILVCYKPKLTLIRDIK